MKKIIYYALVICLAILIQLHFYSSYVETDMIFPYAQGVLLSSTSSTFYISLIIWYFPLGVLSFCLLGFFSEDISNMGVVKILRFNSRSRYLFDRLFVVAKYILLFLLVQFLIYFISSKFWPTFEEIQLLVCYSLFLVIIIFSQFYLEMYFSSLTATLIVNIWLVFGVLGGNFLYSIFGRNPLYFLFIYLIGMGINIKEDSFVFLSLNSGGAILLAMIIILITLMNHKIKKIDII